VDFNLLADMYFPKVGIALSVFEKVYTKSEEPDQTRPGSTGLKLTAMKNRFATMRGYF
jgi:hypothetical protein